MSVPICKDCRYYGLPDIGKEPHRFSDTELEAFSSCSHPDTQGPEVFSVITGRMRPRPTAFCTSARGYEERCGMEGRLFEEKEEPFGGG